MWLKKFLNFVRSFSLAPTVVEISKLNIADGDYLVIRVPDDKYSLDNAEELYCHIKKQLDELNVVLFYGDIEISIIHVDKPVCCDCGESGA